MATASPQPWSGSDPDAEQVVALADTVTIDDVPVGYGAGSPAVGGIAAETRDLRLDADSLHRRACDQFVLNAVQWPRAVSSAASRPSRSLLGAVTREPSVRRRVTWSLPMLVP